MRITARRIAGVTAPEPKQNKMKPVGIWQPKTASLAETVLQSCMENGAFPYPPAAMVLLLLEQREAAGHALAAAKLLTVLNRMEVTEIQNITLRQTIDQIYQQISYELNLAQNLNGTELQRLRHIYLELRNRETARGEAEAVHAAEYAAAAAFRSVDFSGELRELRERLIEKSGKLIGADKRRRVFRDIRTVTVSLPDHREIWRQSVKACGPARTFLHAVEELQPEQQAELLQLLGEQKETLLKRLYAMRPAEWRQFAARAAVRLRYAENLQEEKQLRRLEDARLLQETTAENRRLGQMPEKVREIGAEQRQKSAEFSAPDEETETVPQAVFKERLWPGEALRIFAKQAAQFVQETEQNETVSDGRESLRRQQNGKQEEKRQAEQTAQELKQGGSLPEEARTATQWPKEGRPEDTVQTAESSSAAGTFERRFKERRKLLQPLLNNSPKGAEVWIRSMEGPVWDRFAIWLLKHKDDGVLAGRFAKRFSQAGETPAYSAYPELSAEERRNSREWLCDLIAESGRAAAEKFAETLAEARVFLTSTQLETAEQTIRTMDEAGWQSVSASLLHLMAAGRTEAAAAAGNRLPEIEASVSSVRTIGNISERTGSEQQLLSRTVLLEKLEQVRTDRVQADGGSVLGDREAVQPQEMEAARTPENHPDSGAESQLFRGFARLIAESDAAERSGAETTVLQQEDVQAEELAEYISYLEPEEWDGLVERIYRNHGNEPVSRRFAERVFFRRESKEQNAGTGVRSGQNGTEKIKEAEETEVIKEVKEVKQRKEAQGNERDFRKDAAAEQPAEADMLQASERELTLTGYLQLPQQERLSYKTELLRLIGEMQAEAAENGSLRRRSSAVLPSGSRVFQNVSKAGTDAEEADVQAAARAVEQQPMKDQQTIRELPQVEKLLASKSTGNEAEAGSLFRGFVSLLAESDAAEQSGAETTVQRQEDVQAEELAEYISYLEPEEWDGLVERIYRNHGNEPVSRRFAERVFFRREIKEQNAGTGVRSGQNGTEKIKEAEETEVIKEVKEVKQRKEAQGDEGNFRRDAAAEQPAEADMLQAPERELTLTGYLQLPQQERLSYKMELLRLIGEMQAEAAENGSLRRKNSAVLPSGSQVFQNVSKAGADAEEAGTQAARAVEQQPMKDQQTIRELPQVEKLLASKSTGNEAEAGSLFRGFVSLLAQSDAAEQSGAETTVQRQEDVQAEELAEYISYLEPEEWDGLVERIYRNHGNEPVSRRFAERVFFRRETKEQNAGTGVRFGQNGTEKIKEAEETEVIKEVKEVKEVKQRKEAQGDEGNFRRDAAAEQPAEAGMLQAPERELTLTGYLQLPQQERLSYKTELLRLIGEMQAEAAANGSLRRKNSAVLPSGSQVFQNVSKAGTDAEQQPIGEPPQGEKLLTSKSTGNEAEAGSLFRGFARLLVENDAAERNGAETTVLQQEDVKAEELVEYISYLEPEEWDGLVERIYRNHGNEPVSRRFAERVFFRSEIKEQNAGTGVRSGQNGTGKAKETEAIKEVKEVKQRKEAQGNQEDFRKDAAAEQPAEADMLQAPERELTLTGYLQLPQEERLSYKTELLRLIGEMQAEAAANGSLRRKNSAVLPSGSQVFQNVSKAGTDAEQQPMRDQQAIGELPQTEKLLAPKSIGSGAEAGSLFRGFARLLAQSDAAEQSETETARLQQEDVQAEELVEYISYLEPAEWDGLVERIYRNHGSEPVSRRFAERVFSRRESKEQNAGTGVRSGQNRAGKIKETEAIKEVKEVKEVKEEKEVKQRKEAQGNERDFRRNAAAEQPAEADMLQAPERELTLTGYLQLPQQERLSYKTELLRLIGEMQAEAGNLFRMPAKLLGQRKDTDVSLQTAEKTHVRLPQQVISELRQLTEQPAGSGRVVNAGSSRYGSFMQTAEKSVQILRDNAKQEALRRDLVRKTALQAGTEYTYGRNLHLAGLGVRAHGLQSSWRNGKKNVLAASTDTAEPAEFAYRAPDFVMTRRQPPDPRTPQPVPETPDIVRQSAAEKTGENGDGKNDVRFVSKKPSFDTAVKEYRQQVQKLRLQLSDQSEALEEMRKEQVLLQKRTDIEQMTAQVLKRLQQQLRLEKMRRGL